MRKIIISISLIITMVIATTFSSTIVGAKTYKEDKLYTFKGKLVKEVFYHNSGNYKIKKYVLRLNKPIKVKSKFHGKVKTKTLDLEYYSKKIKKKLKKKLGKKVKVRGKLGSTASPAWSFSIEFLDVTKIK